MLIITNEIFFRCTIFLVVLVICKMIFSYNVHVANITVIILIIARAFIRDMTFLKVGNGRL